MQAMAHPDGEIATSKATAALNVPMGLSNYSTKSLEDVIAHGSGNPYAMQMSLLKNKGAMIKLLKRAEGTFLNHLKPAPIVLSARSMSLVGTFLTNLINAAAGFKAVLVTLDVPWLGRRLNEFRNNFSLPHGMEYPNLFPGVDVTNLEDGDERMVYGKSIGFYPQVPHDIANGHRK